MRLSVKDKHKVQQWLLKLALTSKLLYNAPMQNIEVDLLNKAREIVFASRLSESEKLMIMDRLPFAGNMILKMFVEVCEEDPFSIDYLVKNLKAKLDTQGNLSKISEIIKVEHIELDELLSAA